MLYGDLNKFLIDHKDNVSSNQWIVRIGKKSRDLILLPGREIELEVGMTTDLDSLLGMAGFVPIFPTIPGITIDSVFYDDLQDQALSGFQSHVNFEKTGFTDWARVSYFRDESEIKRYAIFDVIECVTRAAVRVETAVHRLQRRGRCCHRLFFLRRPLNLGTGSTEADSNSYIEATSVELNVLQNFLGELRHRKYELAILSCVLSAIGGTMALVTGSLSLSPTIVTLATRYQSTTDQDPSRQELLKLLPLAKAISPILSTLGISGPDLENDSFLDLLHYAALAVQFFALVVQSYARRFTTPMDFSFLDYPISNFVLEGASFGNTQEKIFARSQELSCLGDMIGSHVLVFGKDMSLVEKAVDVDITAADLIEIWGPAKLAVVQKVWAR